MKSFRLPTRSVCLLVCLSMVCVLSLVRDGIRAQQAGAPGGFVESDLSTTARPLLTAAQIQAMLPTRGRFTFPAPYLTQGIRLTNASDCAGGGDCVRSVGYSYWNNINNHAGSDTMLIALSLDRNKGGTGPTLYSYTKSSGETRNLGPMFDPNSALGWGTGEGWYFSETRPTILYVNDGPKMLRYDVLAKTFSQVFDVTSLMGPNRYIWQMHSSSDDLVHSFTIKDGSSYADLGCAVYLESQQAYRYFPVRGEYDECQIDKSGRYLMIKENVDGLYAEDNVIEDLALGTEAVLYDQNGALGHSDMGFGYGVGEDNFFSQPGAVRVWQYGPGPTITDGRLVFQATSWSFGSNHIAHSDARAGTGLDQQIACSSSANRLNLPKSNEVLCYRLDGSLQTLVAAPVMTNMDAAGGGEDYWKLPKGNIDPTGEYFVWASNMGGNRLDVFMVWLPVGLLGGTVAPPPPPPPPPPGDPTPPPGKTSGRAVQVTWTSQVNTAVSGTTLSKISGCNGCPDAGAVSSQSIGSGNGYVEFTATEPNTMRLLGLSTGNPGTTGEEISYALRLQNGNVEVREKGSYKADTRFSTGDVLRVEIQGGKIQYKKNGTTFYTSAGFPVYPMIVDTSLNEIGATISKAMILSK